MYILTYIRIHMYMHICICIRIEIEVHILIYFSRCNAGILYYSYSLHIYEEWLVFSEICINITQELHKICYSVTSLAASYLR